jgi:hypothetical protein
MDKVRKATDQVSTAKIAMLTSQFASSAVMCPIPNNPVAPSSVRAELRAIYAVISGTKISTALSITPVAASAILAAIRRASSLVSSFAAERRPGSSSK